MFINEPINEIRTALTNKQESGLLTLLSNEVTRNINRDTLQEGKIETLNYTIVKVFKEFGHEIEYAGPYGILPDKPLVSNPLFPEISYMGSGPGCTDISLQSGVIGMAIRNRTSIYIPSVLDLEKQDPSAHHECRKSREGRTDMSEIVIVLPKQTQDGRTAIQEVYDLDVRTPGILSPRAVKEFEEIIQKGMKSCFPEKTISYKPIEGLHIIPLN